MSTKQDSVRFLIVPGLGGSSATHWQSEWEGKLAHTRRVEQREWNKPALSAWLEVLDERINESDVPAVIIAHSLGCVLVAHWLARRSTVSPRVRAALLVAPPDLGRIGPTVHSFGPYPTLQAAPPIWIVASTNDPYASAAFSRSLSNAWQAKVIDVGAQGHINVQSGHGAWPEGEALLLQLLNASRPERRQKPPHQTLPLREAS